ncbi:MAG: hypothetical protein IKN38_05435 [Clostridia bacterium]|nr:hypothetical protein [Clostridia bacterium]
MKKTESFEIVNLHLSGMRGAYEYEILPKDGEAEVSYYGIRYSEGKEDRVLESRALCPAEKMIGILNDCRIMSWGGFHGKHPKGVLDGIMFTFEATVNGGERIHADGSQNFPKHYRDFTDALYAILNNAEER